jgi:hypothetical protein
MWSACFYVTWKAGRVWRIHPCSASFVRLVQRCLCGREVSFAVFRSYVGWRGREVVRRTSFWVSLWIIVRRMVGRRLFISLGPGSDMFEELGFWEVS